MSRVDIGTNKVVAIIPIGPADSEGGIDGSPDAVWMLTDIKGALARIDPKTNQVAKEISVAHGSVAVVYGDSALWVTSREKSVVTRVYAPTNQVTASIDVGPKPRFLTFGGGAVWTLNQGDGTVTRIDTKTGKVVATIEVGVPGGGGEIAFGFGHVWATVFEIRLPKLIRRPNKVVRQWVGPGGNSIRVGHGSVWLSNLRQQNLWRIDPNK